MKSVTNFVNEVWIELLRLVMLYKNYKKIFCYKGLISYFDSIHWFRFRFLMMYEVYIMNYEWLKCSFPMSQKYTRNQSLSCQWLITLVHKFLCQNLIKIICNLLTRPLKHIIWKYKTIMPTRIKISLWKIIFKNKCCFY